MGLVSELRRRNVLRMAALYVVAAWLIMQVAEVIIGLAHLPDRIGPIILGLLAIGFPIALIFSWFYELTPAGVSLEKDIPRGESISRVSGRRLDFLIIALLCAALILFAFDKWWPRGPIERSIAVLPFENMSDDPAQAYFSDGISEDLLNLLAQVPELRVISRSSSFTFKGKDLAIPAIAARLNVAHVLEGTVRKVGTRVRITAKLVDASSDSSLWSATYDRDLDDIFAVQDEIAAVIADALRLKLAPVVGAAGQPTAARTTSVDAYDAYLQGREFFRLRNVDGAIRHLERSLRLDNDFAPAHAQLAMANTLLLNYGRYSLEEARQNIIPHLDRAQELEPDLAEAHAGRALFALNAVDPASTIEHARKALATNPSYVDAMNWSYMALNRLGRYQESDVIIKQMQVIDPLSLIGRWNYAEWLSWRGRFEEAHQIADQLLAQEPVFGYQVHVETSLYHQGKIAEGLSWGLKLGREVNVFTDYVMVAFIQVGEFDEARRINDDTKTFRVDLAERLFDDAIETTQRIVRLDPNIESGISAAATALYSSGRLDEALPLLERLLRFVPEGRPLSQPFSLVRTMRLALARRKSGDENGALAAAQIVMSDLAARRAAGRENWYQDLAQAMIAAFKHDPDGAITALESSMHRGLRDRQVLDDPVFEGFGDEPRFVALKQELSAILAVEHEKVLQLICFRNPVPDDWQPMPETCKGVEEQRSL